MSTFTFARDISSSDSDSDYSDSDSESEFRGKTNSSLNKSTSSNRFSSYACTGCKNQRCTFERHPSEGCYYCNHEICENPLHLTTESIQVVRNRMINTFLCAEEDYNKIKTKAESKAETKTKTKKIWFGANYVEEFTALEPEPQDKSRGGCGSRFYICGDRNDHAYMKKAREERQVMLDAKRIQLALKCTDCSEENGLCKYHKKTVSSTFCAIKRIRPQLPLPLPLPQLRADDVNRLFSNLFSTSISRK